MSEIRTLGVQFRGLLPIRYTASRHASESNGPKDGLQPPRSPLTQRAMVSTMGFEPTFSSVTVIQLRGLFRYVPMVDTVGIEPTALCLQGIVAPLEHGHPYAITESNRALHIISVV